MKFKSSALSRSINLLKLATKVGAQELFSKDLNSRVAQAKAITETLSQLKGAAMKAGQLLSLEIDDYFPPEAIEILGALQNQAKAHPTEEIKLILERELGSKLFPRIQNFSELPVACASIGQVHRAQIDAKPVALKIQYAGVAESVDSDILILRKLAETFCLISGRKMNLQPLFEEFRQILANEVDYSIEKNFITDYSTKISELSLGQRQFYSCPQVFDQFCTERVLAMTWEEGTVLREWLKLPKSQDLRSKLAERILQLYCWEFFEWGLVQTDPNYSNFLVKEELGEIKLVLLDFGSTKKYSPDFIKSYVQLLRSVATGQRQILLDSAIAFGLLDFRESEETRENFVQMMNLAVEPFQNQGKKFDFSNSQYSTKTQEVVRRFAQSVRFSPPPHQIVFLHRKLGGIFALLKKMDIQLDVSQYWSQMIQG